MTFVPCENVLKSEVRFSCGGQIFENVLYFEKATALGQADSDNVGLAIVNSWITNVRDQLSSDISMILIRNTDLTTQTSPAWDYTVGLPSAGADALLHTAPLSLTGAMSFKTGLRGRSYMGRNYVVGIPIEEITGSTMSGTIRDAWENFYLDMQDSINAAGLTWVVCSMVTGGSPRAAGVTTPIISVFMGVTLDNQRRRLPGRGR